MPRFKSSNPEHQKHEDLVTLHGATETATDNGTAVEQIPSGISGVLLKLVITSITVNALDLCDVFVQTRIKRAGVDVWLDVGHFTQVTGGGVSGTHFLKVASHLAQAGFENGTALGANAVRHILGDAWRCRWVIFDGGGTFDFTIRVTVQPMK